MNTDQTIRPGLRGAIRVGVVLLAAGATVASPFAATAPAHAYPGSFIAISVGLASETPPVQTVGGMAIDEDADTARIRSLSSCQSSGGGQCVFEATSQSCAAAASNDYGEIEGGVNNTLGGAQENARRKLQSQQGKHIVISGCSDGQAPPQQPQQPPPPAAPPKLGPTVTFNPTLGGLEAHITDRSGVASQCTYAMDDLNRSFTLSANSTEDLKIVPAVPQFRDRSVTIKCDNGTTTQTTTKF
jgi:Domain of unknown function (DUF4189)